MFHVEQFIINNPYERFSVTPKEDARQSPMLADARANIFLAKSPTALLRVLETSYDAI